MIWIFFAAASAALAGTTLATVLLRLQGRLQLAQRMGQPVAAFLIPERIYLPLYPVMAMIRRRRERPHLERKFPLVLDMLCLSLEAGLDFVSAIARIADQVPNHPMERVLRRLLTDLRLGRSRADALRRFRDDIQIPAATRLSALLIQADKLGTPIAALLREEAATLRFERFQNAERAGQIAAQKLLFPLIFCIMPVVFLVVFGPLAVQLAQNGMAGIMGGGL